MGKSLFSAGLLGCVQRGDAAWVGSIGVTFIYFWTSR